MTTREQAICEVSAKEAEAMSRERLAEDSLDATTKALVDALTKLMYGDPKLAYEAVTGAAVWPPLNEEYVGDLACMAANLAYDIEEAAKLGIAVSAFKINQLHAAEQAFLWLEEDAYEAEREATEAELSRPRNREHEGWQRLMR